MKNKDCFEFKITVDGDYMEIDTGNEELSPFMLLLILNEARFRLIETIQEGIDRLNDQQEDLEEQEDAKETESKESGESVYYLA